MIIVIGYIVATILFIVGIITLQQGSRRSPIEVAQALRLGNDELIDLSKGVRMGKLTLSVTDPLCKIGLYEVGERARYVRFSKVIPIAFPLVVLVIALVGGAKSAPSLIMPTVLGWALGYIIQRAKYRARIEAFNRAITYNLPLVMERIIMAVEAGHDILSAVRTVVEIDDEAEKRLEELPISPEKDPVTRLLSFVLRFVESGIGFDQAIQSVSSLVGLPALKHAFMHLRLAYIEGGAVILPLKELSDSTQLYFQESVEEEIAQLPAKATLPLMCTFAGLIICFLTIPIVEIVNIGQKAQQLTGAQ